MLNIDAHSVLDTYALGPKFSKQDGDWKITFYCDKINNNYGLLFCFAFNWSMQFVKAHFIV